VPARARPPGPPLVAAVEVDEAHRLAGAVRVGDAGPQPAGHEHQMGVRVARLDGALRGVEVEPPLELVMLVTRALREDPAQCVDVRRHALRAEPCDQAPVEEAGRRVRGPVEAVRVGRERVEILERKPRAQLDDVEPGPRRELEGQLERTFSHRRPSGRPPTARALPPTAASPRSRPDAAPPAAGWRSTKDPARTSAG